VCRSRAPQCSACPIVSMCAWHSAGAPLSVVATRSQAYAGTDRQVRGRLLSVLRESDAPVTRSRLDSVWPDDEQRIRALDSLVADGLVKPLATGEFELP
jgi:A/G-specific adenine glycosylase